MSAEIARPKIEVAQTQFQYSLPYIMYTVLEEDLVTPPFVKGGGKVTDPNRLFNLIWDKRKIFKDPLTTPAPLHDDDFTGVTAMVDAIPIVLNLLRTIAITPPFYIGEAKEMFDSYTLPLYYKSKGEDSWFKGNPPRIIFGGIQLASLAKEFQDRAKENDLLLTPSQSEQMAVISTTAHELAHFIDHIMRTYGSYTDNRIPIRHQLPFFAPIVYERRAHREKLARGVDYVVLRKYMQDLSFPPEYIEKFFAKDTRQKAQYALEIESVFKIGIAKGYSIQDIDDVQKTLGQATKLMPNSTVSELLSQLFSQSYLYNTIVYDEEELKIIFMQKLA